MAKKKVIGRPFEKGNKFGKGRPKVPHHIKELKRFNAHNYVELINQYANMGRDELKEHFDTPGKPAIELIIIKMFVESINKGDTAKANFLIERLAGKVKEQVEVNTPKGMVIERPNGEKVYFGKGESET